LSGGGEGTKRKRGSVKNLEKKVETYYAPYENIILWVS
jgi:hypothetical protein